MSRISRLSTYSEVDSTLNQGAHTVPADVPIPEGLSDCFEERLWDSEWFPLDAGELLEYGLTMRFDDDDAHAAHDLE